MPRRYPPPEPNVPPRGATRLQIQRYHAQLHAWLVGESLRSYAQELQRRMRDIPDDLPFLSSPVLDSPGGRRLAENGTPATMDSLCAWIDRQAVTVSTMKRALQDLRKDQPLHAHAIWLRHVDLATVPEIAAELQLSERTVLRYLGIANLRLFAALCQAAGTKTGRNEARKLLAQAMATERDEDDPDTAIAGVG